MVFGKPMVCECVWIIPVEWRCTAFLGYLVLNELLLSGCLTSLVLIVASPGTEVSSHWSVIPRRILNFGFKEDYNIGS